MTPNEQAMWLDIAEAIEPYCVNGAGYIRDYYEDARCCGFDLSGNTGELYIEPILKDGQLHGYELKKFAIEEDLRIFNKDKPGTFEGMLLDGNEH